jgi:TM2 domain-containing membrane protein YozV
LNKGVDVEFKEIPEGTGKMCAGLRGTNIITILLLATHINIFLDGSLDVAVLLTEGIIRGKTELYWQSCEY